MPYEFKLGHNATEETRNICCAKVQAAVDQSTVIRWFKKCHWDVKNHDGQTKSGRPKDVNSKYQGLDSDRTIPLICCIRCTHVTFAIRLTEGVTMCYVWVSFVTTGIAWSSGKLYKLGKVSIQVERSWKGQSFHWKTAPSPFCECISIIFWVIKNKEKNKQIFYTSALFFLPSV